MSAEVSDPLAVRVVPHVHARRGVCLAVPGEIVDLHERHGLRFGRVRFGGITREVCLEYQPDSTVGDFVLVHVGFAIAKIDREEAARQWELLRELEPELTSDEEGEP